MVRPGLGSAPGSPVWSRADPGVAPSGVGIDARPEPGIAIGFTIRPDPGDAPSCIGIDRLESDGADPRPGSGASPDGVGRRTRPEPGAGSPLVSVGARVFAGSS